MAPSAAPAPAAGAAEGPGGAGAADGAAGAGAARALCSGLAAATSWRRTLRHWERLRATSASISAQQCFVLNGTLFIGSILLFHAVLAPLLARLGLELARRDDGADANAQQWARVQALVQEASSLIFTACWLVPYVRALPSTTCPLAWPQARELSD
jgi:hypothetical protein